MTLLPGDIGFSGIRLMGKDEWGYILRSVHGLLQDGVVGNLTDRELLERFASRGGESAESAFAALVERHGAMVFRVCRSVLRDEHEAQDAFQATFLVLARKAGSIWVRDSLGPWLYGVAHRTSSCRRSAVARRRTHERRAAEQTQRVNDAPELDELAPILHDELNDLPQRYRDPMVLCYLEGLTHEQAAERLHCPVGTIRSRLSTGRERLRGRLKRRGFAPSEGALSSELVSVGLASRLPTALAESTIRMALGGVSADTIVPTAIVALVERGMRTMWISRLTFLCLVVLALGGGTLGTLALAQRRPAAQEPASPTKPVSNTPTAASAAPQAGGVVNEQARRALLEARIETVRAILKEEERLIQSGAKPVEDSVPWSRRVMEDRLSLATTPAERQAAIREHRNRMLILEQRLDRLAKAGQVRFTTGLMGKYYRLEADQLLVEQGVDLNQESRETELRPVAAQPPPLPPVPSRPR